jgi:hypothetical protein
MSSLLDQVFCRNFLLYRLFVMQLCLRLSPAELLQLPVILVDTSPRSELFIFQLFLFFFLFHA